MFIEGVLEENQEVIVDHVVDYYTKFYVKPHKWRLKLEDAVFRRIWEEERDRMEGKIDEDEVLEEINGLAGSKHQDWMGFH